MIRLITVQTAPTVPPPVELASHKLVVFHLAPAGGADCEANYFAVDPNDPYPGRTELNLVFSQEQPAERIEELRQLLGARINAFADHATWFVQIAEAVTRELDGFSVIAHSSFVPD